MILNITLHLTQEKNKHGHLNSTRFKLLLACEVTKEHICRQKRGVKAKLCLCTPGLESVTRGILLLTCYLKSCTEPWFIATQGGRAMRCWLLAFLNLLHCLQIVIHNPLNYGVIYRARKILAITSDSTWIRRGKKPIMLLFICIYS